MATATTLSITTGDGNATPRSSRTRRTTGSDLEAEAAGRALTLPRGAEPAQPADQQRVGLEGLRPVDQRVEHLVVAGRGHVELLADRGLLGAGVLPPLALELEDLAVAVTESGGPARLAVGVSGAWAGGVQAHTAGDDSQRFHSGSAGTAHQSPGL